MMDTDCQYFQPPDSFAIKHFRLSPMDWTLNEDSGELEGTYDIKTALWFGISSFLCQGCDILPK